MAKTFVWSESLGMVGMSCVAVADTEAEARSALRLKYQDNDDLECLLGREPIVLQQGDAFLQS